MRFWTRRRRRSTRRDSRRSASHPTKANCFGCWRACRARGIFWKLARWVATAQFGSRALAPGGRLITLEFNPKHAAIARENIARAGLNEMVEVRVGAALDTLPVV